MHARSATDVRGGYIKIITAEDADGPSAFICLRANGELLVISGGNAESGASDLKSGAHEFKSSDFPLFLVFGGKNA